MKCPEHPDHPSLRRWLIRGIVGLTLTGLAPVLADGLIIPGSDGSDGVLAPIENLEIDLGPAQTGAWDHPGQGNGVYDPQQWAVVFKYQRVEIPEGVSVRFRNHPSRAPVVWLVSGEVVINGTLDLNGANWNKRENSEPGPGGFRGGMAWQNNAAPASGGYGPGGAGTKGYSSGNHATRGYGNQGPIYGNARLLPLIGGSGGGNGGAAGGGAILIATQGDVQLDGLIQANGGSGAYSVHGSGAGGAVRVIANRIHGTGEIQAIGGQYSDVIGGIGRIRLEVNEVVGSIRTYPTVDVSRPDQPVVLWPPAGATRVRIVAVNDSDLPEDPRASLDLGQADLSLMSESAARIHLETTNVSPEGRVRVRIAPKFGAPYWVDAAHESGETAYSLWVAETELPEGYFVIQALAENP
jgi:hypothetical protein